MLSLLCQFSHMLRNSRNRVTQRAICLRKFLRSYIQRIKSIRPISTMLQQILLRFRQLLSTLILAEPITSTSNPCSLYSKDKVVIILPVEERHQPLFPCKSLVDEQVLLIMSHGIAKIHIYYLPTTAFKLVDDDPTEVLFVLESSQASSDGYSSLQKVANSLSDAYKL